MISTPEIYEIVKYWLPLTTAGGLLVKAYLTVKKGVTGFADKILTGHLAGIQTNIDTVATSIQTLCTISKENIMEVRGLRTVIDGQNSVDGKIQSDILFHMTTIENKLNMVLTSVESIKDKQNSILSGIEGIKFKVS